TPGHSRHAFWRPRSAQWIANALDLMGHRDLRRVLSDADRLRRAGHAQSDYSVVDQRAEQRALVRAGTPRKHAGLFPRNLCLVRMRAPRLSALRERTRLSR